MSMVNLVSGGLDSTLISVMAKEQGMELYPLFIDYGQRAASKEWETCLAVHKMLKLSVPVRMDLSGFGAVITSGLTNCHKDIYRDAFTPGRNFLFLLAGSSYAYQVKAKTVAIGLLSEKFSLFPDQRLEFLRSAEQAVQKALNMSMKLIAPLIEFSKADVLALAERKGITGTYSCHAGTDAPCGKCVSCLEVMNIQKLEGGNYGW
jgi:7-cyano-7-deazaguanine synthase